MAAALLRCLFAVFVLTVAALHPALAQSQPQAPDSGAAPPAASEAAPGDPATPSEAGGDDSTPVDELHGSIASGVTGVGAWVDSFFATQHDEAENNKSRVTVSLGGFAEEGRDPGYRLKVKARLALPHTGNRLSLLVGGDGDDDSDPENTKQERAQDNYSGADEENAGVGLQYFLTNNSKRSLSALVGLRVKTSGPVGVLGTRYRETLGLAPDWDLRFTQSVAWLTDNGFALPTRFDLDHKLTEDVTSRTTLRGAWYESSRGYFYTASQWIIQRIDDKRGVRYEWNNSFRTSPSNRLQETNLRIDYRQKVWRDWLVFEVAPQVALPRGRDYELTPGIYAGFEVRFGG